MYRFIDTYIYMYKYIYFYVVKFRFVPNCLMKFRRNKTKNGLGIRKCCQNFVEILFRDETEKFY